MSFNSFALLSDDIRSEVKRPSKEKKPTKTVETNVEKPAKKPIQPLQTVDKEGFQTQQKKTSYTRVRGNEKSNTVTTRKPTKERDLESKDSHHQYSKSSRGRYKDHHVPRHGYQKDLKNEKLNKEFESEREIEKEIEKEGEKADENTETDEKKEDKSEEKTEEKSEEKKEEKEEEKHFSFEEYRRQLKEKESKAAALLKKDEVGRKDLSDFDSNNKGKGTKKKNEETVFVLEKKKNEKKTEEKKDDKKDDKNDEKKEKKINLDVSEFFTAKTQKEAQDERLEKKGDSNSRGGKTGSGRGKGRTGRGRGKPGRGRVSKGPKVATSNN